MQEMAYFLANFRTINCVWWSYQNNSIFLARILCLQIFVFTLALLSQDRWHHYFVWEGCEAKYRKNKRSNQKLIQKYEYLLMYDKIIYAINSSVMIKKKIRCFF